MSNNSSTPYDLELESSDSSSSLADGGDLDVLNMDIAPNRFHTVRDSGIAKLVRRNDHIWLRDHGGVEGIVSELRTNAETGIHGDGNELQDRTKTFGSNLFLDHNLRYSFGHFAWESFKDPMILVLFVCSVLSLGFGIQKHGLMQGWQEGVARLIAILATVLISAAGHSWPTFQCFKFSDISSHVPEVDVVRNGQSQKIPISDVVVGDIAFLKPGDQVPADGLFIHGRSLSVETWKTRRTEDNHGSDKPFLSSGGTVVNGYARMLVTAVGKNKKQHKIGFRGTLLDEMETLTFDVEKIVTAAAWVSFAFLLGRFLAGDYIQDKKGNMIWAAMARIVATSVMIALSSTAEGLVMAVKMGFAYSMKRMMGIRVLVKDPSMCRSIASVTTLCINKTGTLTTDDMEVANFCQGLTFIEDLPLDFIAPYIIDLLHQGIGLNTTLPPSTSTSACATNSTEKAIFDWAVKQLGMNIETLKRSCPILEIETFNSKNRCSGVLINKLDDNTIHVHRKGAPEVIIPMCSHYYESNGTVKVINNNVKDLLWQIIEGRAAEGLRCFAFAHRKTWITDYMDPSRQQLILLGFVGLKNPRRIGAKKTVEECQKAGINVKLITGDSPKTARVIAAKCGILQPTDQLEEVVEGTVFRNLTDEARMARVEQIRVLASATPEDKFLMVQCLKKKGHVVACLGQGIGDVMALREADVALCFGTQGAEIAKTRSAVVLYSKDLRLIIDIFKWGRGFCDSIQAYAQFLITATFVSLLMEFVMTVADPNSDSLAELSAGRVPYPVFQLLWVKLITGTLSALLLIIKPPAEGLMRKPPISEKQPLITSLVRTNICIQVLYQVSILLTIYIKGRKLFHVNSDEKGTMILNTYILCQVFTIFDPRFADKSNILEEIKKKKVSWGIMALIIFVQVLMLDVLKKFSGMAKLGWGHWGACAAMAASTLLISGLVSKLMAFKNIIKWPNFMKPKVD